MARTRALARTTALAGTGALARMGGLARAGARTCRHRWSGAIRAVQRDDRGDVPGWVLITLMTAGIVTLLWATAGPMLANLFTHAIQSVKAP